MNLKRALIIIVATASGLMSMTALGQTERDVIEVLRSQVQTNRQAVVAENLGLSEEEGQAFWPVYREFHNERASLADERVRLIKKFADNFETLTDEQAKKIVDDYLRYEDRLLRLRKRFVPKFRKVLNNQQVMRYLQIENKIDDIIDFEISRVIPLAE